MTAPVDLTSANNRTLLLGMKPSKTYHFQISATGSGGTCTSGDNTIATGAQPNGMQNPTITTNDASALYGGFLVTGHHPRPQLRRSGVYSGSGWKLRLVVLGLRQRRDRRDDELRRQLHLDQQRNVPDNTTHVHRVSMDGLIDEDHSSEFAGLSHQLTVLPDETVAFYTYGANMCDDIKLRSPDGTVTTVVNAKTAHGGSGPCHVNAIFYSSLDDTLVFSDLDNNCLTKITRTGATVWVLNGGVTDGPVSAFNAGAITWQGRPARVPHPGPRRLRHLQQQQPEAGGQLDHVGRRGRRRIRLAGDRGEARSVGHDGRRDLVVQGETGIDDDVLGDMQRLPNGNTMVDFATKGTIQEVDPNGNLLQEIKTQTNFGYIQKRARMIGPLAEQHRPLHQVLELADVAGPLVGDAGARSPRA